MTPREIEEYRALRATIRERGTARIWIFVVGMALWTAGVIAIAAVAALPVATLLSLLLLAAVFESIYSIYIAVERIGRYLQVYYEIESESPDRNWEHVAMAFGRTFPGKGTDPLFTYVFYLAAVCNFVPAILAGAVQIEWTVTGAFHLLFMIRIAVAKNHAAHQRADDLERFKKLRAETLS